MRKSENRKKFQRKHAEECFRCGNNHYPSECRFKESKCVKCQKPGHISKKCPTSKKPDKPAFFVDRGDGNTSDSEDSICSIFCTNETDSSNKKFTVKITVGRENVDFLEVTGSVRTIVGESVLRNQLKDFQLTKTDTLLRSYTGDNIGLLGECWVLVMYKN